MHFSEL